MMQNLRLIVSISLISIAAAACAEDAPKPSAQPPANVPSSLQDQLADVLGVEVVLAFWTDLQEVVDLLALDVSRSALTFKPVSLRSPALPWHMMFFG